MDALICSKPSCICVCVWHASCSHAARVVLQLAFPSVRLCLLSILFRLRLACKNSLQQLWIRPSLPHKWQLELTVVSQTIKSRLYTLGGCRHGLPGMPLPRVRHTSVVWQGAMYVYGGEAQDSAVQGGWVTWDL